MLLLAGSASAAAAQYVDSGRITPELTDELKRFGYEQKTWRFGSTTVSTNLDLQARYDSNIFAVSRAPIDDAIFIISPRIKVDGEYDSLKLHGDVFADAHEYASNGSENHVDFGVSGAGNYAIDRANEVTAGARFQRYAESRNDPEANVGRTLEPRQIDAAAGNFGYSMQRNRLAATLNGEIQHLGYLLPEDADRSLTSIRGSLRLAVVASPVLTPFVQLFVNRRAFDQSLDRSGVSRDATTLGATAGVRLPISGRWTGEVGVGGFRSNPDDPTLRTFSGVSANADLTWSPRRRTVLTLRAFNGDVATIRAGAIGRTDARISLRLDQEVRHNLIVNATAGYQKTSYRGVNNELRTAFVDARAEYLVSRIVGIFVDTNFTRRRADPATDGFDRGYVGIGVRLRH